MVLVAVPIADDTVRAAEVINPLSATIAEAAREQLRAPLVDTREKIVVYGICIGVLVTAGIALFAWLVDTSQTYNELLVGLGEHKLDGPQYATTSVALTGMRDATVMKAVITFVGFLAIMLGCVFALKGVEASYKLQLTAPDTHLSLQSGSAGVLLVLIGAILAIFALRTPSHTDLNFSPKAPTTNPSGPVPPWSGSGSGTSGGSSS